MQLVGNGQDMARSGAALDGERVGQTGAGPPLELERQLPGQVVGVVQAGVQAFTAERARQVARVAEQEAPTVG
jgi:hypothetical protein